MPFCHLETPVGILGLEEKGGFLTQIRFEPFEDPDDLSPVLELAKEQLSEYFRGERTRFDLPLCPEGTAFQRRVWAAVLDIPYGETRSYADIARQAGSPKGFRAVGMANHVNPLPIVIPCHRVIGRDGSLTGYGGGLNRKIWLLNLEKQVKQKEKD